jgi:hypothetical protein
LRFIVHGIIALLKRCEMFMKTFHCGVCQSLIFFENSQCLHCGSALAFVDEHAELISISQGEDGLWQAPEGSEHQAERYKLCANYTDQHVCNWALFSDDPESLCRACRLTHKIPNLSQPGSLEAWGKLETAKRRLLYAVLGLRLPVLSKQQDAQRGLEFQFLSDAAESNGDQSRVLTGHDNGIITINVAEADDIYREAQRLQHQEPYRTLLGHFRHEIGHYYWDRLIADRGRLEEFRQVFGDERTDYQQALTLHYEQGPPKDWSERFISAYASTHPWEDWAESWAHVLHMIDALETAHFVGLSVNPARDDEPALDIPESPMSARVADFDTLIREWSTLTYVLNNLTRGLGLADAYPFVLSEPVIDKLRFVCGSMLESGAAVQEPAVAA